MDSLGLVHGSSFEQAVIDGMHPGRTANISYNNGERIGLIGKVHRTERKTGLEKYVCHGNESCKSSSCQNR